MNTKTARRNEQDGVQCVGNLPSLSSMKWSVDASQIISKTIKTYLFSYTRISLRL